MTTKKYSAVIFDMDGTVLNTLDDLTDALNHALKETGHDHAYTTADVRNFFGSGVTVAITRALAIEQGLASYDELEAVGQPGDKITPQIDLQEVSRIQDLYKPYYAAHCSVKTGEYDGINAMVRRLREQGIKVAVVSNKPDPAVQDLAADYFPNLFDKVIGEQPQIRRKPAPDMVQKSTLRPRHCTKPGRIRRRLGNRYPDGPQFRPRLHQCYLGLSSGRILEEPWRIDPRR